VKQQQNKEKSRDDREGIKKQQRSLLAAGNGVLKMLIVLTVLLQNTKGEALLS